MIQKTQFSSYKLNDITEGCKYCVLGEKSVLFITGLCKRGCFYCPLPESRKNIDVVYVNERKLSNVNAVKEAIQEIKLCNSKGIGITGGNPLLVLNRTVKFVKSLKKVFGKNFHIHIYLPTNEITKQKLEILAKSGIDEIRFHPDFLAFNNQEKEKLDLAVQLKKKYNWKVGVEIPVIPHTEKKMITFIQQIQNLDFLNLNEFEIGTLNTELMLNKGFRSKDESNAIKESDETALKILSEIAKSRSHLNVHYCTARTKDAFQYCNRLKKRVKNVKKPFDLLTQDNDLFRGAIYSSIKPEFDYNRKLNEVKLNKQKYSEYLNKLKSLRRYLIKNYDVPENMIEIDEQRLRILTFIELVERLKDEIKQKGFYPAVVKELPAYDLPILQLEWV